MATIAGSGGTSAEGPIAILARGPAAINKGRIPATDAYGTAINADNFAAAVASLGITARDISPTREVQDDVV